MFTNYVMLRQITIATLRVMLVSNLLYYFSCYWLKLNDFNNKKALRVT